MLPAPIEPTGIMTCDDVGRGTRVRPPRAALAALLACALLAQACEMPRLEEEEAGAERPRSSSPATAWAPVAGAP